MSGAGQITGGGGFTPATSLKEAEKFADEIGSHKLPKTQKDAYATYEKYYRKKFPDDPMMDAHLKSMRETFAGIGDITEESFLRVQNAINNNYSNEKYMSFINKVDEDITILVKKKIGNEGGLNRADVTLIFDNPEMFLRSPDKVIPGSDINWVESLLRHEKGHSLLDDYSTKKYREQWVNIYKGKSKEYWQEEVTRYAGTNKNELFSEMFSIATDPTFKEEMWRYDRYVKDIFKEHF